MRPHPSLPADVVVASPSAAVAALAAALPGRIDSLAGVELAMVGGRPTWRLAYFVTVDGRPERRRALADAATGAPRAALGHDEAVAAARAAYTGRGDVLAVEYLTAANVGRHHEYRAQPLPAWAARFAGAERPTAYVAAELGQVIRIRNDRWRAFDFLWMLHTMDYRGRDDFNNLLLRFFSVLGLATVLSGLTLFVLTSRFVLSRRHGAVVDDDPSPSADAVPRAPLEAR
jgi:hypothetical protein